jgi:uncharacterized protein (UPF0332 family)
MSQIDNHLKWCLKDPNRLVKIKPDENLAQQHMRKSEYNAEVMRELETLKRYDWALNVGFYSIYHCFLAILAKYGYDSKNQSCSITVLLKLIDEKKLDFDRDLVLQFDTLEVDKEAVKPTVRQSREISTYGVSSDIDTKQLENIKEIIKKVQRETIKVLNS